MALFNFLMLLIYVVAGLAVSVVKLTCIVWMLLSLNCFKDATFSESFLFSSSRISDSKFFRLSIFKSG